MKISKNKFLLGAGFVIISLGVIRCVSPHVVKQQNTEPTHAKTIEIEDGSNQQSPDKQCTDTQNTQNQFQQKYTIALDKFLKATTA